MKRIFLPAAMLTASLCPVGCQVPPPLAFGTTRTETIAAEATTDRPAAGPTSTGTRVAKPSSQAGSAPAAESSRASQNPGVSPPNQPSRSSSAAGPAPQRIPRAGAGFIEQAQVGPGDRLEILYFDGAWEEGDYTLRPGDEIKIEYLHLRAPEDARPKNRPNPDPTATRSSLDRNLVIQPDGKAAFPYLGVLTCNGLTIEQLTDRLNARYREIYVDPRMAVTLLRHGETLRDLREALRTAGSHLVVVAADGTVNLPGLGVLNVGRMNFGELQREIASRYRRARMGLQVTVRLAESPTLPLPGEEAGATNR